MGNILRVCEDPVELNGVKYFKLISQYPGDQTKNCGLVGSEIDRNFYFLRGNDIDSIEIIGEELVLKKVNGEELRVDLVIDEPEKDRPEITFDNVTGKITFEYPNGDTTVVDGFAYYLSDIAVGSTLDGTGRMSNPLGINPIEITGYYSPVNEYIDLTQEHASLPSKGKGYRILTKESADDFGLLYTRVGMNKISRYLEGSDSEWHIPTNEEWSEMLNAIEICGAQNHERINQFNGELAGSALKSTTYWEIELDENNNETDGSDKYGFKLLPTGNDNPDLFGRLACLWSSDGYLRKFVSETSKVENYPYTTNDYAAIRLVKEYDGHNSFETEDIFGSTYEIVNIKEPENDYSQLWTKTNLTVTKLGSINLEEGTDYIKVIKPEDAEIPSTCFYVIEYTGKEDIDGNPIVYKKRLVDGDCVSILNYGEASYRKIQIRNNELYDEYEEVRSRLVELEDRIFNQLPRIIFDNVAAILTGISNEIKIIRNPNTISIGFADDAIFG